MTVTAGRTATISRPGGNRLVPIVLLLSLALNLCFIVGALWIRFHGPLDLQGSEERYRRMAAELDLTAQQRGGFDRYVAAMRTRSQHMREQVAPLFSQAWDELGKPRPDQSEVMRLFEAATEKRQEFQREAVTQTLTFLAVLSPAQRQKFIAIAHPQRRSRER